MLIKQPLNFGETRFFSAKDINFSSRVKLVKLI